VIFGRLRENVCSFSTAKAANCAWIIRSGRRCGMEISSHRAGAFGPSAAPEDRRSAAAKIRRENKHDH
jgi:hypothetical protein